MKIIITLYALFSVFIIESKVLIFTYSYNRPDFIEIQRKTFQRFLKDEYEFVVFNDASNQPMANSINQTCAQLGIECIRIPQEIHTRPYLPRLPGEKLNNPSVRNVTAVQYSLDILGFDHNDILILVDSDLFLVKPFSIREFLRGYNLGGMQLGNGYVHYLWHGLAFLDMKTLPNIKTLTFNCGRVNGRPIDAGGYSYHYINNNPNIKARYVNYCYSGHLYCEHCKNSGSYYCNHNKAILENAGFEESQIKFVQAVNNVEFYHDKSFLHYRGGTNWDHQNASYHNQKTTALNLYLKEIL